ncbi:CST complex subunit CTC1 isoform X2 [Caloenas nicobarica]|uniref:CST complex subunit CTC1 isoform X2 n=1 Tax=Caloenas nicobarica TaxID=187106 RepID=UPI0032B7135E
MAEPSAVEQCWLQAARDFIRRALPGREGPGGPEPPPLDAVLRCLRSAGGGDLPLAYSFISISDLQHRQCMPCCSHLTWSTNEFKEWAHQGQGALPMQSALPRTYLILVGYLTDRRQENKEKLVDGCLYVKDNTGIIPCELLHFEFEWLESLFLFPSWSYIPQIDQRAAGYLEILVDPVPVNPPEEVPASIPVPYPVSAEPLLTSRIPCKDRSKLTVAGELARLGPLLCISHKTFFFLFLKCFTSAVLFPVLVQGTVTKILNVQAGLFLLDDKVCLCLAYQQLLNSARGLRPGACVELIDVHLLQKPLVSFPFVVLGACLSSTVVLKSFSRLSILYQPPTSSGNLYLQLLFRHNLGMPLYLWLVSLLETFEERFSCFFGRRTLLLSSTHRNPGAAEKFLVPLLQAVVPDREEARDIYNEILAKIHQCPLQKCVTLKPLCQAPSLSAVCRMAEQKSWEGFSPSQLLSPLEAQHMGTQELNRRLAWSYCTLSAGSFQPQLILLGVLRVSSRSSSLQLQDKTSTLPCVISHKDGSPFAHTALLGSLLQVENYQLVVERFLQTDFPSWEQLANLEYVRDKKISVYVQFYFEDVQVLHAAEGQIRKGLRSRNSSSLRKNDGGSLTSDLETPEAKMLKLEDPKPDTQSAEDCQKGQSSTTRTSCVSRLFLVTQKEGLMLGNYQLPREGDREREGQELQRSFQATVLWLGRPRLWSHSRETGNPLELEETSCDGEEGVTRHEALLLFMGKSLRWFPFLHLEGLYRFIVPHCSDLEVFDKLCFPPVPAKFLNMSSCPLCLPIQDTWHLQHETWISCLTEHQLAVRSVLRGMDQRISSIPEVLSNSFTGSLVSFSGEIVERTLCASPKNEKTSVTLGLQKQKGSLLASDHSVKLSISVAPGSPGVVDIYIAATYLQHLWGLLPGAKILFQNLERKISRFHNVYCTYIASSCVSIISLPAFHLPSGPAEEGSSPRLVFLSNLLPHLQHLPQARILCHLSCVLTLSLQWVCSLCSSIFKEGRCTRDNPRCPSHTGVRQASARVLVEDGTGEAFVLCRNQHVAAMLGLSLLEWEALQNCVQSRGRVSIQHGEATGTGCVEEPEDLIACYLRSLCRSPLICRPILLDFSLDRKPSKILQPAPLQLRNFRCGEVDFVSQVGPRLSLLCLNVEEVEQDALSYLNSERIRTSAHCRWEHGPVSTG